MAPGAFSILAPFLGRKSKKYEKLETEDPEKRRQEATQEEISRLNFKIDKLVSSMSKDDLEPATCPEEECVVCCRSRAVMQVAPCGHQSQCRLCFVHNIQEAVATRNLPLRCLLCNGKILRVKNNSVRRRHYENHVVIKDETKMPKSVSGYSLQGGGSMPHSASNYSMSSGFSNMSTSSVGSNRSIKSNSSVRSNASIKSNNSWFSIGSLSSFQASSIIDSKTINKPPRAHSLSSRGKARTAASKALPSSSSNNSIKSWSSSSPSPPPVSSPPPEQTIKPQIMINNEAQAIAKEFGVIGFPSPNTIDNRIRALQGYIRVPVTDGSDDDRENHNRTRPAFRRSSSADSVPYRDMQENNAQISKPIIRRLSTGSKDHYSRSSRFSKSPDLAETTFTMTTIEEEQEISLSLKNLNEEEAAEE